MQGTDFHSQSRPVNQQRSLPLSVAPCLPYPQGTLRHHSSIGKTNVIKITKYKYDLSLCFNISNKSKIIFNNNK